MRAAGDPVSADRCPSPPFLHFDCGTSKRIHRGRHCCLYISLEQGCFLYAVVVYPLIPIPIHPFPSLSGCPPSSIKPWQAATRALTQASTCRMNFWGRQADGCLKDISYQQLALHLGEECWAVQKCYEIVSDVFRESWTCTLLESSCMSGAEPCTAHTQPAFVLTLSGLHSIQLQALAT